MCVKLSVLCVRDSIGVLREGTEGNKGDGRDEGAGAAGLWGKVG